MKWFGWLRGVDDAKDRSIDEIIAALEEINRTASGIAVTPTKALKCATVYAIVRVMSFAFSQLPFGVFEKGENDSSIELTKHPVVKLLNTPNGWQTKWEYLQQIMTDLLLWGNFYAFKRQGQSGPVRQLIPLHPSAVEVKQADTFEITYQVTTNNGKKTIYQQDQIHHIRGLSTDGVVGVSPVQQIREAIALAIAAEQFGATLFGNGAIPYTIIKRPGHFKDPESLRKFVESWQIAHSRGNARRTAVLEDSWDISQLQMNAEESQFLETRKFQKAEIAGAFGVPPHKIGDLERATFSNIEQQALEFVQDSLTPWIVNIETRIARDLFTDDERETLFTKFNVNGLLRADFKTRFDGYKIGREIGVLSPNEIRALEDMNPREDEGGGEYVEPSKTQPTTPPQIARTMTIDVPGGGSADLLDDLAALYAADDDVDEKQSMKVQTIVFSKIDSPSDVNRGNGWTRTGSTVWVDGHGFKSEKIDETETSFRFRQLDPNTCVPGSFATLTRNFPVGITATICKPSEE